jgi:hypothetical protein
MKCKLVENGTGRNDNKKENEANLCIGPKGCGIELPILSIGPGRVGVLLS